MGMEIPLCLTCLLFLSRNYMSGRPPLFIQRVRYLLRTRGYATSPSWEAAAALFGEYVGYYFESLTTIEFLCALADELLITLAKEKDGHPTDHLLDVLLTASTLPSVPSPRERAQYLKTLEQFYDSLRPERGFIVL